MIVDFIRQARRASSTEILQGTRGKAEFIDRIRLRLVSNYF